MNKGYGNLVHGPTATRKFGISTWTTWAAVCAATGVILIALTYYVDRVDDDRAPSPVGTVCVDALAAADATILVAGEATGIAAELFMDIGDGVIDVDAVRAASTRIRELSRSIEGFRYRSLARQCREQQS